MKCTGMRCLAVVFVTLILGFAVSCDDEKELICCTCRCFTVVNPTLGTEQVEDRETEGKGISCNSACRDECEATNWDLRQHARIPCDENPNSGGDTSP